MIPAPLLDIAAGREVLLESLFVPPRASEAAGSVDGLTLYLLLFTLFFSGLIFFLVLVFAIKYRRRPGAARPRAIEGNLALEIVWSVVPAAIALVVFFWGARVYFDLARAPEDAKDIYVLGKQWMWVIEHPEGKRELNELHVPVGRPTKLTMISEDVIHSFYIPAFRVKRDVFPGRYTSMWFTPTREGEYHLFCAEYCGAEHARMIGKVTVMSPVAYENWLSGGGSSDTLAERGEKLFTQLGCITCHGNEPTARGPSLDGLFGSSVELRDGSVVVADEAYVRESILEPTAKVVAGYEPLMPTYRGQIGEQGLLQILSYLQSLERDR